MKITTSGYIARPMGKSIGFDPSLPTTPVPDPIDYSDESAWYIPVQTIGDIALIQAKEFGNTGIDASISATFDDVPTPGGLLIAVLTRRELYTDVTLTGWTRYPDADGLFVLDGGGGGNGSVHLFYKIAGVGESATVTIAKGGSASGYLVIAEFDGGLEFDDDVNVSETTGSTSLTTTALTPAVAATLMLGVIIQSTESTLTIGGGFTEIFQGQTADVGDPYAPTTIVGYRIEDPTSGSYTMTASSTISDSYAGMLLSFTADPLGVNYIPAFAVNDNDNATFDHVDVSQTEFLRGTLDAPYVLNSIVLRFGLENAGSATITVEGATNSDFSDATVIATNTFTGTGSYTAQTQTFTINDEGYKYIRFLLGTAQGIHVHEVSLYGPTLESSHSHTHDHDDEYLTIRYGGGDALSTFVDVGATETIDLANGNVHQLTLDANCTLTFTGADAGRARSFRLYLWQDDVGGWDVTWPGSVEWAGGAPTLDTTAETLSVFMFETLDGGTVWHGYAIGGGGASSTLRWEAVTDGEDVFVWSGDDLVHEFKEYL